MDWHQNAAMLERKAAGSLAVSAARVVLARTHAAVEADRVNGPMQQDMRPLHICQCRSGKRAALTTRGRDAERVAPQLASKRGDLNPPPPAAAHDVDRQQERHSTEGRVAVAGPRLQQGDVLLCYAAVGMDQRSLDSLALDTQSPSLEDQNDGS